TWDKPAAACLSSRIAYGVAVTPQRLARVERAELSLRAALAGAGIAVRDLRVRDLGDRARVELDRELCEVIAARPELLELAEVDVARGIHSTGHVAERGLELALAAEVATLRDVLAVAR